MLNEGMQVPVEHVGHLPAVMPSSKAFSPPAPAETAAPEVLVRDQPTPCKTSCAATTTHLQSWYLYGSRAGQLRLSYGSVSNLAAAA